MPTCPSCEGLGTMEAIVCGPGFHCQPRQMPCFDCNGTGVQTDEAIQRADAGDHFRRLRRQFAMTQREVAKALGVQPVEVNAMECGREGTTVEKIEAAYQQLMEWRTRRP